MKNISFRLFPGIVLISFLIFWYSMPSLISAQEIKFKHITIEDGLSQSVVNCILQDRRGFLWFGTQDGLNVYDGYEFTIYRNDPQDLSSLSDNFVQCLYEDLNGNLWIGTLGGGLNLFETKTKKFEHFKNDPQNQASLSDNYVQSICQGNDGRLWVGTRGGGLNLFDAATKEFKCYKNDPSNPSTLSDNNVRHIHKDHKGHLWIGTRDGGLNYFDSKTHTFEHYKKDPKDPKALSSNGIWSLYEDKSGRFWIATDGGGLDLFDTKTRTFEHHKNDPRDPRSISSDVVYTICEDRSGQLWIGTRTGMDVLEEKTKSFRHFKNDRQNLSSISNNRILSIYEDRTGRLWIGTYGGLNLLDTRTKPFEYYQSDPENPIALSHPSVMSIYKDRSERLWIGTDGGGLNLFDAKKRVFKHYKNDTKDPSSLSNNSVWSVCEDRSGRLWIGTYGGGLNLFNTKTQTFECYQNDPKNSLSLSYNYVYSIYEDRSGRLWIGTRRGLNLFDAGSKSFERFENDPKNPLSLSHNSVRSILEDRSGRLWVGTGGGGLNLYDGKTRTFERYKHDPNNSNSLSHNTVMCVCEDRAGRLWIGTSGGGLNLFDYRTKTFRVFREKDGLANDVIYGILEDDQGGLWLSTNKGLSRFTPPLDSPLEGRNGGVFRNYDVTDGLQSNEFNQGSFHKSIDGRMYFGGIHGFNVFHPDSIKDDPYLPPIVLTRLEIFNKPIEVGKNQNGFVLPVSITESDELILSHEESVFTLEFAALEFALSQKNKYAYKLEGFDKDWNLTDAKRRIATYTNLDPGTYIFRLKGTNHDGIWNEEGRTLKIIITPPWWKTWWAYTIYVLMFSGCIMAIIRFQVNKTKARAKMKESELRAQAAEAEARALRAEDERKQHELEKAGELAAINNDLQAVIKRLRETQGQLVQTEKMASLGQMTAGIAHEINNPLSFVQGNVDYFKQGFEKILQLVHAAQNAATDDSKRIALDNLLREINQAGDEMSGQLSTTLTGTKRIKEIIENLRKFSRVGELGAKETNVNADLEGIIDLFVKQHTGIRIERQFSDSLYLVGDVSELNQCYLNILTNAVQAIRESEKQGILKPGAGIISIHTESVNMDQKKYIRLKFTDNGIGIPEAHKDKIFDPFFTTRAIGQGRGLGLAETYGIIHKHQGTVEVHTEERIGSSFIITLPQDGLSA